VLLHQVSRIERRAMASIVVPDRHILAPLGLPGGGDVGARVS
jgi:hypothetical protein